jgi:hypothetical protein
MQGDFASRHQRDSLPDGKQVNELDWTTIYIDAFNVLPSLRLASHLNQTISLTLNDYHFKVTSHNKMKTFSIYNYLLLALLALCALVNGLPLAKRYGGRATFYQIGYVAWAC